MTYVVAVDSGGTFSDCVVIDQAGGVVRAKSPSTPPRFEEGVVGSVTDAALIGTVLGVNALMSGVQRVGADRALKRLVDLSAVRVRLRRPGREEEEVTATAEELVPGDVVMLGAGDAVPADLRILAAEDLEVDESSLTGESQLVTKSARPTVSKAVAERTSMLYEGTVIAAGNATGVVVATGDRTEIGRTAHLADGQRPGGVESRLQSLTAVTLPIALGAGAGLFLSDLLRGRSTAQALGPAVSLAVVIDSPVSSPEAPDAMSPLHVPSALRRWR